MPINEVSLVLARWGFYLDGGYYHLSHEKIFGQIRICQAANQISEGIRIIDPEVTFHGFHIDVPIAYKHLYQFLSGHILQRLIKLQPEFSLNQIYGYMFRPRLATTNYAQTSQR